LSKLVVTQLNLGEGGKSPTEKGDSTKPLTDPKGPAGSTPVDSTSPAPPKEKKEKRRKDSEREKTSSKDLSKQKGTAAEDPRGESSEEERVRKRGRVDP
jgi:hypothetical protein